MINISKKKDLNAIKLFLESALVEMPILRDYLKTNTQLIKKQIEKLSNKKHCIVNEKIMKEGEGAADLHYKYVNSVLPVIGNKTAISKIMEDIKKQLKANNVPEDQILPEFRY